jgi:aspartate/tyrosine/aromatic aminotransferase
VGGIFIAANMGGERVVHLPNPTWGNHGAIFKDSGLRTQSYRYFLLATKGLDFDGMCADLKQMEEGAVVLLHSCAHNPTGVDLTPAQVPPCVRVPWIVCADDTVLQPWCHGSCVLVTLIMDHVY